MNCGAQIQVSPNGLLDATLNILSHSHIVDCLSDLTDVNEAYLPRESGLRRFKVC